MTFNWVFFIVLHKNGVPVSQYSFWKKCERSGRRPSSTAHGSRLSILIETPPPNKKKKFPSPAGLGDTGRGIPTCAPPKCRPGWRSWAPCRTRRRPAAPNQKKKRWEQKMKNPRRRGDQSQESREIQWGTIPSHYTVEDTVGASNWLCETGSDFINLSTLDESLLNRRSSVSPLHSQWKPTFKEQLPFPALWNSFRLKKKSATLVF